MKILLTGQGGFIGSRLRRCLLDRGHRVPPLRVEFREATDVAAWAPHLEGVDVVINTAGIFKERHSGDLDVINRVAPCALFRAAAAADVRLVIQFSALGADGAATSRFHLAKRAADDCLREQPMAGVSLQPSLVFGVGGASAALMTRLAGLPLVPLPGEGRQRIQPIHVDDLVAAVVALVEQAAERAPDTRTGPIALVGPRELTLREYLDELRKGLGLAPARFLAMPMPLMSMLARVAAMIPGLPVDAEAMAMLERGNVADDAGTRRLLGQAARDPARFIDPGQASAMRTDAALAWLLPMLRLSLAVMWFWAGFVSIWVYPLEESYRLLAGAGVPAALAPLALYGAAATDIVLGILTLAAGGRRIVWQVQLLLVLVYTAIITVRLPEFLWHPFGPIVKNLPILATLWLLAELAPRGTRRRPPRFDDRR
jgi:uncharacterized protein YbjT (DUF2867 family)